MPFSKLPFCVVAVVVILTNYMTFLEYLLHSISRQTASFIFSWEMPEIVLSICSQASYISNLKYIQFSVYIYILLHFACAYCYSQELKIVK